MTQNPENPCLSCGACCAYFRVSFYWAEADPEQGGLVPPELTEDLPPIHACMKGTNGRAHRCVALQGEVGGITCCAIYDHRPSPCRDFGVHWEEGIWRCDPEDLARCNRARTLYHLSPLVEVAALAH